MKLSTPSSRRQIVPPESTSCWRIIRAPRAPAQTSPTEQAARDARRRASNRPKLAVRRTGHPPGSVVVVSRLRRWGIACADGFPSRRSKPESSTGRAPGCGPSRTAAEHGRPGAFAGGDGHGCDQRDAQPQRSPTNPGTHPRTDASRRPARGDGLWRAAGSRGSRPASGRGARSLRVAEVGHSR
jgi:hypothetical protein